jgi:hypothetical protein
MITTGAQGQAGRLNFHHLHVEAPQKWHPDLQPITRLEWLRGIAHSPELSVGLRYQPLEVSSDQRHDGRGRRVLKDGPGLVLEQRSHTLGRDQHVILRLRAGQARGIFHNRTRH